MASYIFTPISNVAFPTREEFEQRVERTVTAEALDEMTTQERTYVKAVTAEAVTLIAERLAEAMKAREDEIIAHFAALLSNQDTQIAAYRATTEAYRQLAESYKAQVDRLPATGSGGPRQPKIGEPPEYKGSDDKVTLLEWVNHLILWCEHEGIATDKQRIIMALSRLRGPAARYMESYYTAVREQRDLGTWSDFLAELHQIYGQRDDKSGAKKEITTLFTNKDLAAKDFVKYAEKFRALARIAEYSDDLLIDKLREVIPRDMRLVLAGKDQNLIPKDWKQFLELLLDIYRIVNPEKTRGSVFNSGKSSNDTSVPMDIDNVEKKGKGKNKRRDEQASVSEKTKKKFCHICKKTSHDTQDCYELAKNASKKPRPQQTSEKTNKAPEGSGKGKRPEYPKKKTRIIEVEVTDDEDDTPQSSNPEARIVELPEGYDERMYDEILSQPRSSTSNEDFLKRRM